MKRKLSILLCLLAVLCLWALALPLKAEAAVTASGSCGENVTWRLTETGGLSISGTGPMTDYVSASDVPWYDYRDMVTFLEVWDGVTRIGSNAFHGCENLAGVMMRGSVASIGDHAFAFCTRLRELHIPESVASLGENAFRNCSGLDSVRFHGRAPDFGADVFAGCHLTASYPGNNGTWNAAVRGQYGGSITWEAHCFDGHSYSQPEFTWDGVEGCSTEFVCGICGDRQRVTCQITSQTTPATLRKDGQTVYTASVTFDGRRCTDTKTVILPRLEHTDHTAGSRWYSDSHTHWKECSQCGREMDPAAHTPGAAATESTAQTCTVCDCVLALPEGLKWFAEQLRNPREYLYASGYYTQIMEQYASYFADTPQ